jgi:hypothetical protein
VRARVREISLSHAALSWDESRSTSARRGASTRDEKLMTQTGGAESARNLPDLANEGASDEEAVGDTIRALVNHGWRS